MARRRKSSQHLLGIVLCIPIAFIVYFAISYTSHNISADSVSSVSLTLPSGEQYNFNDSEQIAFFVDMLLDSKSISSPVRDITGESPIILQYDRGDKILKYKLYPQLNLTGCMLVDNNDSFYLLTSDSAVAVLVRPELQYIYSERLLPTLTIKSNSGESRILPSEYSWLYKKIDGNYYSDNLTGIYDPAINALGSIYPDSGSSLVFSVEPSELSITFLTAQGDKLAISDISFLSFDNDTHIEVSITAKWSELGGADFYGEATYTFPLLYDIRAVVSLEKTIYNVGDIALVRIKHLNENEQIVINTQLDTSGIVCFTQEDTTFALLPISLKNNQGVYSISLEVGGRTYNETLTIEQIDFERSTMFVTDADYQEMLSPNVLAEASAAFSAAFASAGDEAYFTFGEAFILPLKGTLHAKFGKEVLISTDATVKRVPGVVYKVSEGTAVKASQRGRVVFAEALAATGNTVIVDHGFGVMTLYFNLKSFDCAVGDLVQQGEIIAFSGSTGFTEGLSILHYAVAVNGIFVNPAVFNSPINLQNTPS